VTAGTENPNVQEFIDWIISPEGQELVEKTGYVGVGGKQTGATRPSCYSSKF
jgi:ABC-type phosphate transport system substrate-binding protein